VLRRGIASLPPGRLMQWVLGVAHQVIEDGYAIAHTATVRADGPFGPLDPLSYTIQLDDLRHVLAVPPGTLNGIRVAIDRLTKAIGKT
jgi:hypothetical protein